MDTQITAEDYDIIEKEFCNGLKKNKLYNISEEQAKEVFKEFYFRTKEQFKDDFNPFRLLIEITRSAVDVESYLAQLLKPYIINPSLPEIQVNTIQDLIDLIKIVPFTPNQLKELMLKKGGIDMPNPIPSRKRLIEILETLKDEDNPNKLDFPLFYNPGYTC